MTDPCGACKKKKRNACLPPRRGQVKVRIFNNFVKGIASMASKAGEALRRNKGGDSEDSRSPASVVPPSSSCNSDADFNLSS